MTEKSYLLLKTLFSRKWLQHNKSCSAGVGIKLQDKLDIAGAFSPSGMLIVRVRMLCLQSMESDQSQ